MLFSTTEDLIINYLIIHKELVELVKLFSSVEEDRDDLVDGEQEYAKAEDDVGVEGDELVNSVLSLRIFATVGAVPCNPPWLELWVLQVGAIPDRSVPFSNVWIYNCVIVLCTIVFLIMLDISGLFVSSIKYGTYLAILAEYRCAQDDGVRDEDDPHQQQPVHTEVLQLLPPGPHDCLGLAVTKNLRIANFFY